MLVVFIVCVRYSPFVLSVVCCVCVVCAVLFVVVWYVLCKLSISFDVWVCLMFEVLFVVVAVGVVLLLKTGVCSCSCSVFCLLLSLWFVYSFVFFILCLCVFEVCCSFRSVVVCVLLRCCLCVLV